MFVLKRVQQPSDSQGRMGLPRQACLDHLAAQRIPRCPPPSQCTPGGRDKRLRKPFAANTDFIRSSDAFLAGRWCFQASGSLTDSAGTVPICHNKRGVGREHRAAVRAGAQGRRRRYWIAEERTRKHFAPRHVAEAPRTALHSWCVIHFTVTEVRSC